MMTQKIIKGYIVFKNNNKVACTLTKDKEGIFVNSSELSISNNDYKMEMQIVRISNRFVLRAFLDINDDGNYLLFFPSKYPELIEIFDQNQIYLDKYLVKINWLVTFYTIWGYISVKYTGMSEINYKIIPFVLLFPIIYYLLDMIYYQIAAKKYEFLTSKLVKSIPRIIIEKPNEFSNGLYLSIIFLGIINQLLIISIIITNENILIRLLDVIIFTLPSIIIGRLYFQIKEK